MIRRLLERAGSFEVVGEAGDGAQGYELALSLKPDVVVMDVSMPGMNGREALRKIAAAAPEVPVVMLSCYEETAYARDVRDEGARGYVVKDYAVENLVGVLKAVLSGERFSSPGFDLSSDPA